MANGIWMDETAPVPGSRGAACALPGEPPSCRHRPRSFFYASTGISARGQGSGLAYVTHGPLLSEDFLRRPRREHGHRGGRAQVQPWSNPGPIASELPGPDALTLPGSQVKEGKYRGDVWDSTACCMHSAEQDDSQHSFNRPLIPRTDLLGCPEHAGRHCPRAPSLTSLPSLLLAEVIPLGVRGAGGSQTPPNDLGSFMNTGTRVWGVNLFTCP